MSTASTTSVKIYIAVFVALMLMLGATIAVAYVDLGQFNLPAAMAISLAKTGLIILFFMHVRGSSRLVQLFACVGFAWLAILLIFAMNDYLSRSW